MEPQDKISILLLDDKKEHFEKIKRIIKKIIKENFGKSAEFIYTYNENKKITKYEDGNGYYHLSKFGGSENIKKTYLNKLDNLLNKIQYPESVIAIIDINWDETEDSNRYGRQFYIDHLSSVPKVNVIFISFIKKDNLGKDLTLGFKYVYKNEIDINGNKIEFGEPFLKDMREQICNTDIKQTIKNISIAQ